MPDMKINPVLLEKQPIVLEGEAPGAWLEVEDSSNMSVVSPVRYKLTAGLVSGSVLVRGHLSYSIAGTCGRCLAGVSRGIEVNDISLLFDDLPADELDIADDIREEALLALPVNLLCADDCAGLCPVCGADLNNTSCSCQLPEPAKETSPWDILDELKQQ